MRILDALRRRPDSGLGNIRVSASAPGRNIDWVLMLTVAALSAVGLATVFSTSRAKAATPYQFVIRQEIFLIFAVVAMVVVMIPDYEVWREYAMRIYVATVVLLIGILGYGAATNKSRLSYDLGPFLVQPAEFAKVSVTLALAAYLADERTERITYARFAGGLILIGVPAVLILVQPDLGSASVIIAIAMGMLLVAGARFKHIALITALSILTVAVALIAKVVNPYQIRRVTSFIDKSVCVKDPEVCRQGKNALAAVASGGITGRGWLEGPLTNSREIAVQWADFPFSGIGEQFGLLGAAVLIGLFAVLLFRIWRIGQLSRDSTGTFICAGVFSLLLWQVFQNIGMTVGIMPITGLPLPFISYGGSGTVSLFALIGLVQNVYMRRYR